MSLFPNEDNLLTKEIESWKGFADSLNSQEYKELFNKMLNDCYKYAKAINAKEKEPFPNTTESLIMALLLSQHVITIKLTYSVYYGINRQYVVLECLCTMICMQVPSLIGTDQITNKVTKHSANSCTYEPRIAGIRSSFQS
jgi:hypothetical protein